MNAMCNPGPGGAPSIAWSRDVLPAPSVRTVAGQAGSAGRRASFGALAKALRWRAVAQLAGRCRY